MSDVTFAKDDSTNLLCPACQGSYLHHGTVIVYDRASEDAPSYAIVVDREGALLTEGAEATRNPSSRRHGVAIRFECENCDTVSELTLAQHKGCTHLEWRRLGRFLSHTRAA